MNPEMLIYIAVGGFTLMVIGLVLTVAEFRRNRMQRQAVEKLEPSMPKR